MNERGRARGGLCVGGGPRPPSSSVGGQPDASSAQGVMDEGMLAGGPASSRLSCAFFGRRGGQPPSPSTLPSSLSPFPHAQPRARETMLPESAFYGVAPADLPARPVRAAAAGRRASLREPTASDGERKKKGGRGGAEDRKSVV